MASRKKPRHRVSYVLPLANSPNGHRLGVNSLAVDCEQSILYSGGRDGVVCAWNVDLPLQAHSSAARQKTPSKSRATTFRGQAQSHTHWVNDVLLVQNNQALVSASSDITVKVWRPHAQDGATPATIGLHNDYVKCLASPGPQADWVASGGLDHKIRVWDLNGGGEKLQLHAAEDEGSQKGSVYALSVRGSIMASGGPESILRLWDPKSGKRITKFVGHTDNIRDILINESGDTVMTASSDQTIKIWSMAAGRCMNTLTMHNDSVWSLYSDHPQLGVFYSSDRSGLVAKTDVRGSVSMDEGISVAVAQEHEGVAKVVVGGDYIWTATSSSSINRWRDVDTAAEIQAAESPRQNRLSSLVTRPKLPSPPVSEVSISNGTGNNLEKIPLASVLKISNAAAPKFRDLEASTVYSGNTARKPSESMVDIETDVYTPVHNLPEETIEGQNGLIKHLMLNDRKRVLTLDTAGDVVLWDLIKCAAIRSFGKRHLEDVIPEVNTQESVANWCTVDTRTGALAIALEENYCFDAEMYADEIDLQEVLDFRDDQRVNLGKWVLRYLFTGLIDEEIKRDEAHRAQLRASRPPADSTKPNIPRLGHLPSNPMSSWKDDDSAITPRPTNSLFATTPGLAIGVATPGAAALSTGAASVGAEEGSELKKIGSGNPGASGDYFSSNPPPVPPTPADKTTADEIPQSPSEPDKDAKSSSLFGKKFKMNMSFPKKLSGRPSVEVSKPPVAEDTKSEESDDKISEKEDKIVEDSFYGIIQKIHNEYEETLERDPDHGLAPGITPSMPNETPVLKLPPFTSIIIQEDKPESGGIEDLYRGTVECVGKDASIVEKVAPMWLGDLLLRNQTPIKDIVKVSFILMPYQASLPGIAGPDGNSRLNANRMLRAKKILGYVSERIDPVPLDEVVNSSALKPEDYLELYCQNQLIPPNMTLATIRAYVWKTGGDVVLYYKSNGRKPELEEKFAAEKAREAEAQNGVLRDGGGTGTATAAVATVANP